MSLGFNYRHLYYFWVVAKEGGMARAAARLGMAVQTVSTQVRELERALGHALLKPAGRGLVLTEAGMAALRQADQIFQLGEQLPELVREAVSAPRLRLAVGISDGLPKLVVRRLLQPVLAEPQPAPAVPRGRVRRPAGRPGAAPAGRGAGRPRRAGAPQPQALQPCAGLVGAGLVCAGGAAGAGAARLPAVAGAGAGAAAHRPCRGAPPHRPVVRAPWACARAWSGEFEDSALLVTFGAAGMGVFPAPELIHDKLSARYEVKRIGACDGVEEHFFAIGTERKIQHPLVQRLLPPRV